MPKPALPQRPFDPADWPIAWMARAERQHARNATALLAPLGLRHAEFRLLALLGVSDDLEIAELAERAVLERSTVSKMVERLVAEGWVRRTAHAADRRRSPLRLSDAGRALLARASVIVEGLFRRYQAGRETGEAERFLADLRSFYQRVRDAQEPLAGALPLQATRRAARQQFAAHAGAPAPAGTAADQAATPPGAPVPNPRPARFPTTNPRRQT